MTHRITRKRNRFCHPIVPRLTWVLHVRFFVFSSVVLTGVIEKIILWITSSRNYVLKDLTMRLWRSGMKTKRFCSLYWERIGEWAEKSFDSIWWTFISVDDEQMHVVGDWTHLYPESAFNKLDFPAPLGPIMTDSWPVWKTPETPLSSCCFFFAPLPVLEVWDAN